MNRGDIEIINFMLNRWSSLDLWDENFIQQISEYSVNSGCLLTVEYILHQILKRNLVPPFASMLKQAIMNGHLHICRYLRSRLTSPILTPEEATSIMDETLRQNNVPIAKYVLSFLPVDQLDMSYFVKTSNDIFMQRDTRPITGEMRFSLHPTKGPTRRTIVI